MKKVLVFSLLVSSLIAGPTFNEVSKYTPSIYKLGTEHLEDSTVTYNCKKNIGVVAEVIKNHSIIEYKVVWNNIRTGGLEVLSCSDYSYWSKHTDTLVDNN